MVVCICNAVRDTDIEHARRRGVTTLAVIAAACGAGAACGTCREAVLSLLTGAPASSSGAAEAVCAEPHGPKPEFRLPSAP